MCLLSQKKIECATCLAGMEMDYNTYVACRAPADPVESTLWPHTLSSHFRAERVNVCVQYNR